MAKLILRGKIAEVGKVTFVGENKLAKQSFILFEPGDTDDFTGKKYPDNWWKIEMFGDKVQEVGMAPNSVDKKAECKIYINSNKGEQIGKDGETVCFTNSKLASITIIP